MTPASPELVRFVCAGLDHPEGLCFASDGSLVCGSEAGAIYRIDTETSSYETTAQTGGFVLGVSADRAGAVYACDAGRNEVVRVDPGGGVEAISTGRLDNPNDCAFDAQGNLFFTESGTYHPVRHSGRLFVITPEGKTRCIHPGPFQFANGVFIDHSNALLYMVESTAPSILVFRIDGPQVASMEPVRQIPLEPGTVPDGVALDTEGNIYVAYYSPDQIGMIRADDRFEVLYRDPLAEWMNRPTNVALRKDEIYFANLGGWHIGAIEHPLEPILPFLPDQGPCCESAS